MKNSAHESFPATALLAVVLAFGIAAPGFGQASASANVPAGEEKKVEGMITVRNGDSLTVKLPSSELVAVKVSGATEIREKKSNFFRKGRKYGADQLTPGLAIRVEGRGDSDGALLAQKILIRNDDLKMAQSVNTRVNPVEENQLRMSGQIGELEAVSNAAKGGAKAAQVTADSAHARIAALDDYEALASATVRFKAGSAVLSAEARRALDDLALQAAGLKGFVIEIAGFASSEGSLAFNRRLSRQRAEAVSEYLAEKHDIPLRRIMTPTGYGVSHPVSDNSSRQGRQENRRVEVRLMVSRGIAEQASAGQPSSNDGQSVAEPQHHP